METLLVCVLLFVLIVWISKMDNTLGYLVYSKKPPIPHPAMQSAAVYIESIGIKKLKLYKDAFETCDFKDNDLYKYCCNTLYKLLTQQGINDVETIGLAWILKELEEVKKENPNLEKIIDGE